MQLFFPDHVKFYLLRGGEPCPIIEGREDSIGSIDLQCIDENAQQRLLFKLNNSTLSIMPGGRSITYKARYVRSLRHLWTAPA
jgi:hypothetical protein